MKARSLRSRKLTTTSWVKSKATRQSRWWRATHLQAPKPTTSTSTVSQDLERSTNVLVNAIKENYPQMNSTKRVHDLMIELEGTENRISTERQNYNTSVTTFPGSLFHRSTVAYFKADKGAKTAPKVDLDN